MTEAGGISFFHVIVYLALGTGTNCIRIYINHFLPFLIQWQIYKCQFASTEFTDDQKSEICTRENICDGDPRITSWEIDYANENSLRNLNQQLDLMCEPEWKGGLLGSVLYFFWCITLLFVPRLADKFGRRWLYLVSRLCECLLYTASMLTNDYWVMLGIMSTFGFAATGRLNVSAVYL